MDKRGSIGPRGLLLAAALLGVCAFVYAEPGKHEWQLEQEEDGIALYTSDSDVHSYDVVRAVATLDARPEAVLAVLREIERYPSWYYRCKQTRVLTRPALAPVSLDLNGRFRDLHVAESYVLFFLQATPPLSDRWAVIQNTVHVQPDGSLVIAFRSLETQAYSAPPDAVRMTIHGSWVLSPLSPVRTRVRFELDVDPHTDAFAFLVDPKIHDMAVETIRNLRRVAARSAAR